MAGRRQVYTSSMALYPKPMPPNRLVVSAVYDLPFGRKWITNPGWRRSLLRNWRAAGILASQTGSPFTVNLPSSESGSAIAAFGNPYRPDVISNPYTLGPVMANPKPACHTTISQGGLAADVVDQPGSWFNTCAFAQPPAERERIHQRNGLARVRISDQVESVPRRASVSACSPSARH